MSCRLQVIPFQSALVLSLVLSTASVASAGPWKNEWGQLFGTPHSTTNDSKTFSPQEKLIQFYSSTDRFEYRNQSIDIRLVDELPHGAEFRLDLDQRGDDVKFLLEIVRNPKAPLADTAFILALAGLQRTFFSSLAQVEVQTNLENGSPSAKYRMLANLLSYANSIKLSEKLETKLMEIESLTQEQVRLQFEESRNRKTKEIAEQLKETQRLAVQAEKGKMRQWEEWKRNSKVQEAWENLPEKLNDLVLNNDRVGVRKMIEAYLPWPVMEPVEKAFWKQWLEAIEHPNRKDVVVGLRGVDYSTDYVQRRMTPDGERLGFFSTLLTQNQGNYTRRLRSLATRRLENGQVNRSKGDPHHVLMTRQMEAHSSNPRASVFLSFTVDPMIAYTFTGKAKRKYDPQTNKITLLGPGGGLLAVAVDSRRFFPNFMSHHAMEVELLAPLIIFPDEVISYEEYYQELDPNLEKLNDFVQRVNEKVKGKSEPFKIGGQFGFGTEEIRAFQAKGTNYYSKILKETAGAKSCTKVFTH